MPGLNAPIPTGARYGFGASEWGKPPVDAKGNPLYGGELSDVSGVFFRGEGGIRRGGGGGGSQGAEKRVFDDKSQRNEQTRI